MKKLISIILAAALAISLTACGNNIVGTWKDEQSSYQTTYKFNEDGSGSISMKYSWWQTDTFNYEVKGDSLFLWDSSNRTEKKIKLSGNKLTIDGDDYTRQSN